ncbi:MAG: T9SS type A sorting domain-containing protein [Bacteroidales bacterium]|nr:T9SS type A sorting domain-containing protein [Bacteroidales bacterium]MCF8345693.1 T9SS type A sorting domain-containing protein [Bacteroidales bacterium]
MKAQIVVTVIFVCISILLKAQIIHVPGDRSSIQGAIDAASNGDTVLVDTGTYYENINFQGKAITVSSHFLINQDSNYIYNTIINGSQPSNPDNGSVVIFESGEDTTSVLCGFTITGGTGSMQSFIYPLRVGGGIVFFNSGGKVINNIIKENTCILDTLNGMVMGGGIGSGPPDSQNHVIIRENTINANLAWTKKSSEAWTVGWAQGGAIFMCYDSEIEKNHIHDNICKSDSTLSLGGAIRLWNNVNKINVKIHNNEIQGNQSIAITDQSFAGGISCSGANTNIQHNIIAHNITSGGTYCLGTGMYFDLVDTFDVKLIKNKIIGNYSLEGASSGGGIGFYRSNIVECSNNLFTGNEADNGGAIAFENSTPNTISNNTIISNSATQFGGAIYLKNTSSVIVENSILRENTANGEPNEVEVENGSTFSINYSNIEGSWNGTGNIDNDPLFKMSGEHPYQLMSNSPCIDTATPDTAGLNLPEFDMAGSVRFFNSRLDIGAYEWNLPTSVANYLGDSKELTIDCFPNPFHTNITIEYDLEKSVNVYINIFNQYGQQIDKVINGNTLSGKQQLIWSATRYPDGIYFIQIRTKELALTRKIIKVNR